MAKSWFLMHVGKHAVVSGCKVVHVTLEMTEPYVLQRYWQSCFGLTRYDDDDPSFTRIQRYSDRTLKQLRHHPGDKSKFCLTQDDARSSTQALFTWDAKTRPAKFSYRPHYQFDKRLQIYQLAGVEAFGAIVRLGARPAPAKLQARHFDRRLHRQDEFRRRQDALRTGARHRRVGGVGAGVRPRGDHGAATEPSRNAGGLADLTHISEAAALTHTAETILIYAQNKKQRQHKLARVHITKIGISRAWVRRRTRTELRMRTVRPRQLLRRQRLPDAARQVRQG